MNGSDRAYSVQKVIDEKVVHDKVGGVNLIVVVGLTISPYEASVVRALSSLRKEGEPWLLMDSVNNQAWDSGMFKRECLEQVPLLKDFWFDCGSTIHKQLFK